MKKNYCFLACLLSVSLLWPVFAMAERVIIDISAADLRKIPVAVPYLLQKSRPNQPLESGQKMAEIINRGLTFHGFISIVPPDTYGGAQEVDWQNIGAELVVLGQYGSDPAGIELELRLIEVKDGKTLMGRRYHGAAGNLHNMLLKFCDDVIFHLTKEEGVSFSRVAFVSKASGKKEIYIADVLGEKIEQLTKHQTLAVSPRFSPDGSKIAYTSYHKGNPDLYLADLARRRTRAISWRPGLNMAPAWSPDGNKIVLTMSKGNKDGYSNLFLVQSTAEQKQQLKIISQLTANGGSNVSATWSPDGNHIAFVSDRSGNPQIYVMNIKNNTINRITYNGNENTTPNWSPKGDLIAYTGLDEGHHHIFVISPDGGTPTKLTAASSGENESPCWAPDGRQLVFARRVNGESSICTIFKTGRGLQPLFQMKGAENPQWSPRLTL